MQAFILAGGFGTRLAYIVKDVPKPMAPIGRKPFLAFLIENLKNQGIKEIVLLTGHKSEQIESYFGNGSRFGVNIQYSVETSPLGTGGAILKAANLYLKNDNFLVLNGDTYFDVDCKLLMQFHEENQAVLTIGLKYKKDVKRYGNVEISGSRVSRFTEKNPSLEDGLINGGIYAVHKKALSYFEKRETLLSFENEVMPLLMKQETILGIPFGGKFIDIGVPEDYSFADQVLKGWQKQKKIKAAFLDRDGIINKDKGYTNKLSDLEWVDGIISFLKKLARLKYQLIIVTNQAGIAKGKFTEEDYLSFQKGLTICLKKEGIIILDSFYCPFHKEGTVKKYTKNSFLRKPNPGMILEAADLYNIDISKSIMVGDKASDRILLPCLKSYILKGAYPLPEGFPIYQNFDEILEGLQNG
jgi:D,D-heptose 1,7-bisphosphate phosphatase